MPGITELVQTQLQLVGGPAYSAGLRAISGAAGAVGGVISSLVNAINPLNLGLAGLGAGVTLAGIAEVNGQFEESQRLIAGIFATMGMSSDFNAGLAAAADTMDMITVAAARLPGEAEDYINVFQTGLTVVQQTFGGTTQEMTQFTNQYTAIMSTLGVASSEAAFSLNRALAGGRGQVDQQSQAFMRLIPFIQQATRGTAHQVANIQQFNQLTQQQRGEVLRLTLAQEGLASMLEDAGTSWGAQTGALASMSKMMLRMSTSPLFEAMKTWLGDFNALFMDSEGSLTSLGTSMVTIGQYISETIVGGVNSLVEFLGPGVEILSNVGKQVQAMVGPIFDQLFGVGSKATSVLDNFWPVVDAVIQNGLIPFLEMMAPVITILIDFAEFVYLAHVAIAQRLYPSLMRLWTAAGHLFSSIGALLAPIARLVTGTHEASTGLDFFIFTVEAVVTGLTVLIEGLARFNDWIHTMSGGTIAPRAATDFLGALQQRIQREHTAREREGRSNAGAAPGTPTTPAARPGTSVHQDFRGSRFDITQKFAEGFDPDRVAVAFADDVGRLGEQRLQSGLEPLFGAR